MPSGDDIRWFKSEFQQKLEVSLAGSPCSVDFLVALACQETGYVWSVLRRAGLSTERVLQLCVGDTLDFDRGRRAFPQTKEDLIAAPNGQQMFDIARQALVDMAQYVTDYKAAAKNPRKFCHGFGLFQRDLQFFKDDPSYFLNRDYEQFERTLGEAIDELSRALRKLGLHTKQSLSDMELAAVGIVYNTGSYQPSRGLKQGYFNGTKYYGEALFDYLRLAHTISVDGTPLVSPPSQGFAAVLPPTPVTKSGAPMRVRVTEGMLRVREEPLVSNPPQKNVIGHLPDGQVVQVLSGKVTRGFVEVETSLHGALLHGYVAQKFLEPAAVGVRASLRAPQATSSTAAIGAVYAPRRPGDITRRRGVANALSLNEPSQPSRNGTTADELRGELDAIIDWLDVENPAFLRYRPRNGLTFCNIYAHDFCHLAGVYLPRVWWTPKALIELSKGTPVEPRLGATISEQVANELFAWLRDFGTDFGWRASGTLTELQTEVNQGAVGVIVARRKESNRPGHIAVVVPETLGNSAKRDSTGNVVAPLQSQAGSSNFRRGTGRRDWWRGEQFAEFSFWLHA